MLRFTSLQFRLYLSGAKTGVSCFCSPIFHPFCYWKTHYISDVISLKKGLPIQPHPMRSSLIFPFVAILFLPFTSWSHPQSPYPVRGLCIAAPVANQVENFISFIDNTLAPEGVNTLILRIDFRYQFTSRPELTDLGALNYEQVKQLVNICQKNNIRLIPQINLLGHQSWQSHLGKLLEVYPQFDETPEIELPETYTWPNDDGLYCKSYCSRHPEVHQVIWDVVDEIIEVFEADAFHAGLDEVFYIGHDNCERCKGFDPSVLFAEEVNRIHQHLQLQDKELWMWGDRLIDGRTTGIGMWEGSYNHTWRAIDLINKNAVICDWHYERADPTAVLFAAKGFRVLSCPWRNPDIAVEQEAMVRNFITHSTPEMKDRYLGMLQTVWSSAEQFIHEFRKSDPQDPKNNSGDCFRALSKRWK